MEREKVRVYYDGSCTACSTIIENFDRSKQDTFLLHDVTLGALPHGVDESAAMKTMHVVADGKIYRGARAMLRLIEEYPQWQWAAAAGQFPVVSGVLALGYFFFSRARHRFGRRR